MDWREFDWGCEESNEEDDKSRDWGTEPAIGFGFKDDDEDKSVDFEVAVVVFLIGVPV